MASTCIRAVCQRMVRPAYLSSSSVRTSVFVQASPLRDSASTQSKRPVSQEVLKKKTPVGKLDSETKMTAAEQSEERHRDAEKEPLTRWPGGLNTDTGELGGPSGREPTRYGDWERKGRVSDF